MKPILKYINDEERDIMRKHQEYSELQFSSRKLVEEKRKYELQLEELEKSVLGMPEEMQQRIKETMQCHRLSGVFSFAPSNPDSEVQAY